MVEWKMVGLYKLSLPNMVLVGYKLKGCILGPSSFVYNSIQSVVVDTLSLAACSMGNFEQNCY